MPIAPDEGGAEAVLRAIVEGTISRTGEEFFAALSDTCATPPGTSGIVSNPVPVSVTVEKK